MTRVLLVEDQQTLAEALQIAIDAQPDLECVGAAGTAEEALCLTQARRPDVVLMDIHLPGADGIDGTRRIKAVRPCVRIFILTGDATPKLFADAAAAGATGFLAKDGPFRDILAAIRASPEGRAMVAGGTFAALITELRREAREPTGEENWAGLTRRETEVLALIAEDLGTRLIAARLGVSEHTARGHVKQVLRKLRVHSRRDAVLEAARTGLLTPHDGRRGEAVHPGRSGHEDGDMDFPYGDRLRAEFGPARDARQLASSPRSNVWHAFLDGTSAVVKQIIGGPDAPERFTREVTALRLAARTVPAVVPRLLGTDPGSRTLVLEHLSDEGPSPDWVVVYAAGLARLHATTGPTDAGALPRWEGPGPGDVRAFLGLADELGIPAGPDVADELSGLVERLGRLPGHALLHGDPCPANDLYVSGDIRFVDLEQSSLGNGLTELAYLRIGFPTCWCVTEVTAPVLERAEAAYRAAWEAAKGSPVAGDLVDACAGWLIRGDALVQRAERGTVDHLARLLKEDWSWGTVTARERLTYRLGVVADLARDHPDLGGLSRLSAAVRDRAVVRWPGLGPPPWHHGRAGRPGTDGRSG